VLAHAVAATLSGSGSSIVAVTVRDRAAAVAAAMLEAWRVAGRLAQAFTVLEPVGGFAAARDLQPQPIVAAEV